jgi:microcystin-dependent protein
MAQPYIGEIRMFGGNFAPAGWAFCDGQSLPISENEALFQLIGTTYGGDGQSTFALPDLRGRVPLHQTNGPNSVGQSGGVEEVTLTTQQIPVHTHPLVGAKTPGNQTDPAGNLVADSLSVSVYINDGVDANMAPQAISVVGGSQPHENRQSYLAINFILSLFGIFPTQT